MGCYKTNRSWKSVVNEVYCLRATARSPGNCVLVQRAPAYYPESPTILLSFLPPPSHYKRLIPTNQKTPFSFPPRSNPLPPPLRCRIPLNKKAQKDPTGGREEHLSRQRLQITTLVPRDPGSPSTSPAPPQERSRQPTQLKSTPRGDRIHDLAPTQNQDTPPHPDYPLPLLDRSSSPTPVLSQDRHRNWIKRSRNCRQSRPRS